jgi:hypothetical protein
VSLILEALKKLERDKQVPDRGGFLVMAARPWPANESRRMFVASLALAGFGVAGLAVASVWWWQHRPHAAHADMAAAPPALAPLTRNAAPAIRSAPAAAVREAVSSPAPAVREPRVPPSAQSAPAAPVAKAAAPPSTGSPELRLTAVSERDGRRVAILNDRMVYEGDSFDGVKVLHIGDNEVELDVNGRRQVVKF